MELSIVIVNWNTRDMLCRCLKSIYENAGIDYLQVIVVDNNSQDGSVNMVRNNFLKVEIIVNAYNAGNTIANNQGMRLCKHKYIMLLNSDTIIKKDSIIQMLSILENKNDVGIIGPRLIDTNGQTVSTFAKFPNLVREIASQAGLSRIFPNLNTENYLYKEGFIKQILEPDYHCSACIILRKEVLDNVGYMNESIFLYGNETEWQFRIRNNGWKIINLPKVTVVHLEGQSGKNLKDKSMSHYINGRYTYFSIVEGHFYAEIYLVCTKTIIFFKLIISLLLSVKLRKYKNYSRYYQKVYKNIVAIKG